MVHLMGIYALIAPFGPGNAVLSDQTLNCFVFKINLPVHASFKSFGLNC